MFEPFSVSPLSGLCNFSPFSTKTIDTIFDEKAKPSELSSSFAHLLQENEALFSPIPNFSLTSPVQRVKLELDSKPQEIIQKKPPLLKLPSKQERITKKTLQKEQKVQLMKIEEPLIQSRQWNLQQINNQFADTQFQVTTKTRCEQPSYEVPDILYSSLKYEVKQTITGNFNEQFILGRISVVDTQGKPTSLNEKGNLLKGIIECALTKQGNSEVFEGTMKAQFVDCSYHHKKGDFCWQLQYFLPSNLENPIISLISAPFKVFARKPTTKKRENTGFEEFSTR